MPTAGPQPASGNAPAQTAEKHRLVMFWLSLIALFFFYVNLQFYSGWINRSDPIPLIPPGLLGHVGTFLGASVLVPLAAALKKYRLAIFSNPEEKLSESLYKPLSNWVGLIVSAVLALGCYLTICMRPMLHLSYEQGEDPPLIKVNGRDHHFNQGELGLFTDKITSGVVIIDTFGFFHHRVDKGKDGTWLFPFAGHVAVDVSEVLPRRDFSVTYIDPLGNEYESVVFRFSDAKSISDEDCKASSMPVENCEMLLKKVLRNVFENNQDYRDDSGSTVLHGQRRFTYKYLGKSDEVKLVIRDTNEKSELARTPESGFTKYWRAAESVRAKMISQFQANLPGLPNDRVKSIYSRLWAAEDLQTNLRGTPKERQVALEFVASAFETSGEFFLDRQAIQNIELIAETNLVAGEGKPSQLKLAVAAICALAKDANPGTRSLALDLLGAYFENLGSDSNNIKVEATQSVLTLITRDTTQDQTKKILYTISLIYRNAYYKTQEGIKRNVEQKSQDISREELTPLFIEFLTSPRQFMI